MIRRFIALAVLLFPASINALPPVPTGLYVGTLLNAHPLPRIERVPSQDGWEHWFRLMGANITLRPDGRFMASFKYYRQHVRPRAAVRPGPLLNETYKGKFTVKGTQITFVPDPNKQSKKPPPIVSMRNRASACVRNPYARKANASTPNATARYAST